MISLTDWTAVVLLILAGVVYLWIAIDTHRNWNDPGSNAFVAFTSLLAVDSFAVAGVLNSPFADVTSTLMFQILLFALVAWVVFTLQYTGRGSLVTPWRVAGLTVIPLIYVTQFFETPFFFGISIWFLTLFVAIGGSLTVLATTFQHVHLPLGLGAALSVAAIPLWFPIALLTTYPTITRYSEVVYALAFSTSAGALVLALYHYRAFEATAAAGTLGREVMVDELADPLLVVDGSGRIIEANSTAIDLRRGGLLGEPLPDSFDHTVKEFRLQDTVEYTTDDGRRAFDSQVTELTDQHGRILGHVVGLRDITDRQRRQQRLQVLARMLRHNFRNDLQVVQINLETAAERATESVESLLTTAQETTDKLLSHAETARNVQTALDELELVHQDLGVIVPLLVEQVRETYPAATIEESVPESITVEAATSLQDALWELLDNACEHTGSALHVTVSVGRETERAVVTITDDGPGIPEYEYNVLEAGEETGLEHASGLGLWFAYWVVTAVGGDLTFDTDTGTTVRVTLPLADAAD